MFHNESKTVGDKMFQMQTLCNKILYFFLDIIQ
jgi:hypothetical protein